MLHGEEPTAPPCLHIDLPLKRLSFAGRALSVRSHWALVFAHVLISGQHTTPHSAATLERMQQALQPFGLTHALRAVEWSRIVDGLIKALQALDPTGALAARLQHWPRGKTVGPWWFDTGDGLVVSWSAPQAALPQPVASNGLDLSLVAPLAMTMDPHGGTALALTRRFKAAMEAQWKALPAYAVELLEDGAAWVGESEALRALRRLRLAEMLSSQGDIQAARAVLDRLTPELVHPELQALFGPHLDVLRLRLHYSEDPLAHHAGVARQARAALSSRTRSGASWLDPTAMAEHFHLLLLCERRWLEQHPPGSRDDAHQVALLHSAHAALLLYFLVHNQERAQHVCANLGYAHQKLAATRPDDHVPLAIGWHELSFGMHASFGGAEGSAWEYIFLGELWLDHALARRLWAEMGHDSVWCDTTPAGISFYDAACELADQLDDARQKVYTRLNRYRFALEHGSTALRRSAGAALTRSLDERPDMLVRLIDEGYRLPAGLKRRAGVADKPAARPGGQPGKAPG